MYWLTDERRESFLAMKRGAMIVFFGLLGVLTQANAITRTAASPSFIDVNAAINGRKDSKGATWQPLHDGDTLVIPAGSATWRSTVTIKNKSLTVKGAGIGLTNITADPTAKSGTIFRIENCGSKFVSVSDITWIGSSVGNKATFVVGKGIRDVNTNIRLHHMHFVVNRRGVMLLGRVEGVIDHCTFRCSLKASCQGVTVWGDAQYRLVPGKTAASFPPGTAWTAAAVFGDSHRAFIEDCDFDFDYKNDAAVEGYYGAKYCVRYCTIKNTLLGSHGLDSGVSSMHNYEAYNNAFQTTSYTGVSLGVRGGTALLWGNTRVDASGTHGPFNIKLECYRATGKAIFGNLKGGFITGSNPYDGNQSGVASDLSGTDPCGWPALESVGTTGPITLLSDHSTMNLSPVYTWNNTSGVDLAHQTGTPTFTIGPTFTNLRASGTNLAIDAANSSKVTSATRSFAATDEGSWINITGGVGFNVGWKQISSTSGGAAIFASSAGAAGSTNGTWSEYWTNIPTTDIIKENRDYYRNTQKPNYTPFVYPHPLVSGHPLSPQDSRVVH
jgi:hypothetical protein